MAITILPAIKAGLGGLSLYGWARAAASFGAAGAIPIGGPRRSTSRPAW